MALNHRCGGQDMRLVTWNCNGALRRKFLHLDALDADILVVQECEDPAQSSEDYQLWASDYAWVGYGKNKGIGIFPRRGQSLERLDWPDGGFELFLPVRIAGAIDVLGVWTQQATPASASYIGQFWHYLQLHRSALGRNAIIAGDFNSNAIWDLPRRTWNHSDCVRELKELGFRSLYHHVLNEEQGQETYPTFYLHRHETKPYHLDFVFAHEDRGDTIVSSLQVGWPSDWLTLSDHMPIVVDL